jgi:hypothetical protein
MSTFLSRIPRFIMDKALLLEMFCCEHGALALCGQALDEKPGS